MFGYYAKYFHISDGLKIYIMKIRKYFKLNDKDNIT